MKAPAFEYVLPESLAEVHEALSEARASDVVAKILAGGQSLVPLMNFRLARPDRLVDINRIGALRYHDSAAASLRVGALCRHADIEKNRHLVARVGALADAIPLIGHAAIRSRGTVVGSLAHGDSLAEWISLALLLDGTVLLSSTAGERVVPAGEWLQGYLKTAAEDDEIVREASFSLPGDSDGTAFVELARRHGDFCLVSAGAFLALGERGTIASARVVLAGIGPVPFRDQAIESLLAGEPATAETFERVVAALPKSGAQDDVHATAAYRHHAIGVITVRALMTAARRAQDQRR